MDNYNNSRSNYLSNSPDNFGFRGSYDNHQDYINLENCGCQKDKYC